MSPGGGGAQTPRRGASSCWLQADPRSNLITLGSLVRAYCVAAAGVQKVCRVVSFPAGASLKKGAPGPQARAGRCSRGSQGPEVWGPPWAQMGREERPPRLHRQGELACWKGQHSRRTGRVGKGLEPFLGEGMPSPARHLGRAGPGSLRSPCPVAMGRSRWLAGGGATSAQAKPGQVAHTGPSLRPWHQPRGALRARVNDSFVANFCWPLPGNSQAGPFPRLQESKSTGSLSLG